MALEEARPEDLLGDEGDAPEGQFLFGTGSNDALRGGHGDDLILGAGGDDRLSGEAGNDVIFGASSRGGAVDMNRFTISEDYTGSVTFLGETAGYRNVLGMYRIADDGSIYDVQVLFGNASLQGSGGNLVSGESSVDIDLHAGDQIGFFVVPNGYSRSGGSGSVLNDEGSYLFRDADGNPGNASGGELQLVHVSPDGEETVVESQYGTSLFHSLGGAEGGLNGDGLDHVTGEVDTQGGSVRIGFEDLWNGGDRDYDDSVFRFDIGVTNAALLPRESTGDGSGTDNDLISGGAGDDDLFGMRGDDTVSGGEGDDRIWGNSGDDVLSGNDGNDAIRGGSGNDGMSGGEGDDAMSGNSGNDTMSGGAGNDDMSGDSGDDAMSDGAGDDTVDGGSGDDFFVAGTGDDSYRGGSGYDTVSFAGAENGVNVNLHGPVATGLGTDELTSIDSVIGSSFDDTMKGDKRDNTFDGGSGDDVFRGLGGNDLFIGGEGNDTFVWLAKDIVDPATGESRGVDLIQDFSAGDILSIDGVEIGFDLDTHSDLFRMEDRAEGTMVSVRLGGEYVDVVMLQSIHQSDVEEVGSPVDLA